MGIKISQSWWMLFPGLLAACSLNTEPIALGEERLDRDPSSSGSATGGSSGTGGSEGGAIGDGPAGSDTDGADQTGGSGGVVDATGGQQAQDDDGSTGGSVDPGPPVDPYAACANDTDCTGSAVCAQADNSGFGDFGGGRGGGFNPTNPDSVASTFCSPTCAATADCLAGLDGAAVPTCASGSCYLDCAGGVACPTGMQCVDPDVIGPSPSVCSWAQ